MLVNILMPKAAGTPVQEEETEWSLGCGGWRSKKVQEKAYYSGMSSSGQDTVTPITISPVLAYTEPA